MPGSLIRRSASVPRPTTSPGGCRGCWLPLTSMRARARRTWVWVAVPTTLACASLRMRNRPVDRSLGLLEPDPDRAGEDVGLALRRAPAAGRTARAPAWSRRAPGGPGRSPTARRGSRWAPAAGRGTGSGRCCRARARGRRRSRPAARRCGRSWRRHRRSSTPGVARSAAAHPRHTSSISDRLGTCRRWPWHDDHRSEDRKSASIVARRDAANRATRRATARAAGGRGGTGLGGAIDALG